MLGPDAPDVCIEAVGFHYMSSWLHKIESALMLETDTSEILNELIYCCRKVKSSRHTSPVTCGTEQPYCHNRAVSGPGAHVDPACEAHLTQYTKLLQPDIEWCIRVGIDICDMSGLRLNPHIFCKISHCQGVCGG